MSTKYTVSFTQYWYYQGEGRTQHGNHKEGKEHVEQNSQGTSVTSNLYKFVRVQAHIGNRFDKIGKQAGNAITKLFHILRNNLITIQEL